MAVVVTTLKIMPSDEDVDLEELFAKSVEKIKEFVDENHKNSEIKKEIEAVFGPIKALKVTFSMDEKSGDTEPLENSINDLNGVDSVTVISQSRALG